MIDSWMPQVGDDVMLLFKDIKYATVTRIHPRGVPMSLEDVLRFYQPIPKFDRYVPTWEKPHKWDRVICISRKGNPIVMYSENFNPHARYFCGQVVKRGVTA